MANRIALRELQSRLTNRLQAVREQPQAISWLAIESGAAHYLFPLTQADEIFSTSSIQPVPYAHAWFIGVANLRGGLFGVFDLASFVGGSAASRPSVEAGANARMVTVNAALEVNCAVLIDRLAGLRGLASFQTSLEAPEGSPDYFGQRYVDANQIQWQELNLQTLVRSSRFLEIGV